MPHAILPQFGHIHAYPFSSTNVATWKERSFSASITDCFCLPTSVWVSPVLETCIASSKASRFNAMYCMSLPWYTLQRNPFEDMTMVFQFMMDNSCYWIHFWDIKVGWEINSLYIYFSNFKREFCDICFTPFLLSWISCQIWRGLVSPWVGWTKFTISYCL